MTTEELPALVELRESMLTALVVEDWQRRCDASLIASFNKRQSETKPAPPLAKLGVVLFFLWAVAIGLSAAYGHLGLRYAIPSAVLLVAGGGLPGEAACPLA